jgi:hypothetical protein
MHELFLVGDAEICRQCFVSKAQQLFIFTYKNTYSVVIQFLLVEKYEISKQPRNHGSWLQTITDNIPVACYETGLLAPFGRLQMIERFQPISERRKISTLRSLPLKQCAK